MFAESEGAESGSTDFASVVESYREEVLREVHHRVKNHLQVLQALVRYDAGAAPALSARQIADRLVSRIGSMAAVYRAFQDAAVEGSVSALGLLRAICEPISTDRCRVIVRGNGSVRLSGRQAELMAMLVSEAVCNSLEHGFPEGRAGKVQVAVRLIGDTIRLTIDDDGIGLPVQPSPGSNGLKIMAALARELNGWIGIRSRRGGGARVDVRLPQADDRVAPGQCGHTSDEVQ